MINSCTPADSLESGKKSSLPNAFTDQQKAFIYGMRKLRALDEISTERPLTKSEDEFRQSIYKALWNAIYRYGFKLAHDTLKKYRTANDALDDVQQDLYFQFQSKLKDYDPTASAPTTYFKPHFQEVISKYTRDYSQHMTQNQSTNLRDVRKAISSLTERGISITVDKVAVEAGLSYKVTADTLNNMHNSIYADIDECHDVSSNQLTPEEAFLEKEKNTEVMCEIDAILSKEEYVFLAYYAGVFDNDTVRQDEEGEGFTKRGNIKYEKSKSHHHKTYTQLAEHFGIPIHEAKNKITNILNKLSRSPVLQRHNKNQNYKDEDLTMSFIDNDSLADKTLDDIADSICDFDE